MDLSWDHKFYTAICNAHVKHSQGQKLNLILEDITVLFHLFFRNKNIPFDMHYLWLCCFEIPITYDEHRIKYAVIYDTLKNKEYESLFSIIIIALQDPPKEWWNNQYELLMRGT